MSEPELNDSRLLEFSRRLQFANDYAAMLEEVCREVREATGYNAAWVGIYLPEKSAFKILTLQAAGEEVDWDTAAEIPISEDPYLTELVEDGVVTIVEDAQTDPRVNREIVEALGNRTVVNLPMTFGDHAFGALGTGSFGEEGVRVPTPGQLAYLQKLANNVTAASVRIVALEQRNADRARQSRAVLEELAELVAAIRTESAQINGDADQVAGSIAERARRAAELIEQGRTAMSRAAA